MRIGSTELLRSFYVLALSGVALSAVLRANGNYGVMGVALFGGFSLLVFLIGFVVFRHYDREEYFATKRYAIILLGGAMATAIASGIVSVVGGFFRWG